MEYSTLSSYSVRQTKGNKEKIRRNIFPNSKSSSKKLYTTNAMDSRVGRKLANTVTLNRFSIYDVENISRHTAEINQRLDAIKRPPTRRDKSPREPQMSLYFYKNRYKYPPRSPRTRNKNRRKNVHNWSCNSNERIMKRRFSLSLKLGGERRNRDLQQRNKKRDQTADKQFYSDAEFYAAQVSVSSQISRVQGKN